MFIMVNFGKAFTYIFEDENWFDKLIVPVLVSLIPVVGAMAFLGYTLRTVKNVAYNEARPLPVFSFGEDLRRGFRYFLIQLVYSLPIMIVTLVMLIPLFMIDNNNNMGILAVVFMIFGSLIILAYSLFLAIFQPIAMANFAVKDTFSSAFEWGNFFRRLRNNFPAWLIVLAGVLISSFITPLGSVLLLIGAVITSSYSQLMVAHLAGQAYTASESQQ